MFFSFHALFNRFAKRSWTPCLGFNSNHKSGASDNGFVGLETGNFTLHRRLAKTTWVCSIASFLSVFFKKSQHRKGIVYDLLSRFDGMSRTPCLGFNTNPKSGASDKGFVGSETENLTLRKRLAKTTLSSSMAYFWPGEYSKNIV